MTIEISLTNLVDFAFATTPASKLRVVRTAKAVYAQDYDVARDYYGPIRKSIVKMHKSGAPPTTLDAVLNNVSTKKHANYGACIKGHKKWMKNKSLAWYGGHPLDWTSGGLRVSLNPELFLSVNGQKHVLKLYLKGEGLAQTRAGTMLHLLEAAFGGPAVTVGILDVRRSNLMTPSRPIAGIDALLAGEAASFREIWKRV